uniref:Probable endopolygalacturonase I n=1 Tax=Diabrotica virgifera virgifera TaxID=50390 RepID=A0A6P7H7Q1_DIAVI
MNYIKFLIVAFISTVSANNNCTITEFAQVAAVVKECSNIVINDLVVPAYSTLLLNLQNGSRVTFTGNVLFEVGYWEGPLLEISGDGVQVQGNAGITEDGIYINQDYGDIGNYSREIEITNLKMSNIYGSVQGVLTRPVHIVCSNDKCQNWTWSNINILGGG